VTRPTNRLCDFDLLLTANIRTDELAKRPDGWMIRGRVRSAYRVDPGVADFGDQSIENQPFGSKKVIIEGHFPIDQLQICESDMPFTASIGPVEDRPNAYWLTIKPIEHFPLGSFNHEVLLRAKSSRFANYPDLKIPVTGRIVEDVQASPPRIDLGSCTVGQTAFDYVTFSSSTRRPFSVENWETLAGDLAVE
jgi:hypothetical protein